MTQSNSPPFNLRRLQVLIAAAAAGGVVGLLVVLTFVVRPGAHRLTVIDADVLADARARWEAAAMTDYQIEVVTQGPRTARYVVVVRAGEPQQATLDGRPLRQQRTFGVWTVAGLFETIEDDLRIVQQVATGAASADLPQLALRGEFDLHYGCPLRYQRTTLRRFGANQESGWTVVSLQPLSTESGPLAAVPHVGDRQP